MKTRMVVICCIVMIYCVACGKDDKDEAMLCHADYDCLVGYVCVGGSANDEGECTEAQPGTERTFAEISLDIENEADVFLLSVFSLPTGVAAPSGYSAFTVSSGGSSGQALRLLPTSKASSFVLPNKQEWDARIAFENTRRQHIQQLVDDVRAKRRMLKSKAFAAPPDCSPCENSTTQMCWHGTCTSTPILKDSTKTTTPLPGLPCTLIDVVSSGNVTINVLLDDNDDNPAARTAAIAAAEAFASALGRVHPLLGNTSGHTGALDRDEDGRLTVVYTNELETLGIVGAFRFADFLKAADPDSTQNQADLLWARVPTSDTMADCPTEGCTGITQELSVGTLVHEYTHLANFAKRVWGSSENPEDNEVLWLDEGMAHLMEDISGYGASNIGTAAQALAYWPTTVFAGPEDSVEQRGMAYMLLRYLLDTKAKEQGASTAAQAPNAFQIHKALMQEKGKRGFAHSLFQKNKPELMWHWLLATYATDNTDVTNIEAKKALYLQTAAHGDTSQLTGFSPFGEFEDARGVPMTLYGPDMGDGYTVDIVEFFEPLSTDMSVSGSYLYRLYGFEAPGTLTLTATGDAFVDFHMKAQKVQ